ncbi:MAG: M23 family metallopeptidase, partial [Nitrospinota bacterium]
MASLKPRQKGTDLGIGGVSKEDLLDQMEGLSAGARRLAGRVSRQLLDLERRASGQQVVFQEIVRVFQGKRVLLAHTPSIWPVKGWVTSGFGRRTSVFTGRKMFHAGIDIVARKGTPILAPADGVVIKSGRESGYGKIIKVRHLQGIVTRYAHNHKNLVRVGQRVRRGQILGTVGSSGRSTGPHLHYEVRVNGVAVNPRLYILEVAVARR